MAIEKYVHHGAEVSVISEVKGKHRQHCLCHSCLRFIPEDRTLNCSIANALYALCVNHNLVTPVYECETYEPDPEIIDENGNTRI